MTATLNSNVNGRKESRRSLSQELDRLDKMLDGLAEAIPASIADAIKESVATAVAEAFRVTLMEVVANPEMIAMLRGAQAATPAGDPVAQAAPPFAQPVRNPVSRACQGMVAGVKTAVKFVTAPIQTIARGAVSTYRQLSQFWNMRKAILIALAAGIVVGAVAYASAPWLAGVLAGCGAASATLLGQFAAWSRRLYASFSFG